MNGSGKHNNWSIAYGKRNLLEPGDEPRQNVIFLTVLAAIIRAVDLHADILRASTVSAGNKHRPGANEAPPAIISVFLGEQLTEILEKIGKEPADAPTDAHAQEMILLGGKTLPPLPKDATDRNRTSPFAFTGNKFEFRACGSSQSCAGFNMTMNTIAAESIDYIAEKLERLAAADSAAFHEGLAKILAEIVETHKRVIFNGNNYAPEWVDEAHRRGLPVLQKSMQALRALVTDESLDLFERYGVFTRAELLSRFEVFLEEYHRKVKIEGGIALEIAQNMILPVVTEEYAKAVGAYRAANEAGLTEGTEGTRQLAADYGTLVDELNRKCREMKSALNGVHEEIIDAMARLREAVDRAEQVVNDELWPLPKYREMLFLYN